MRIAVVGGPYVPVPPLQYGGIEQIIYFLICGLIEAGHEPILFAPGDSQVDCQVVPIVEKSLYFPRHKPDYATYERQTAAALERTKYELRRFAPSIDIIHSHQFDLREFQDVPNLTTLHNPIKLDDLQYYLDRKDMFYVSISKNQQEAFPDLQYMGVVYNGENPDQFPFVNEPEDYVCFLGRIDREKNPHLAIQLAINLGIKIKFAGKIDYLGDGYFEEEIEQHLNDPLVEYMGELGFEDKIDLLSKAKCNLHPVNFREPFGLTVLEAAYCGTPTLALARGSMPELIEEGRTGMLVEDFVEGYHAMEACTEMDRQYIATRARQLFNYRIMTRQYIEVYERVIDITRRRREYRKEIKHLTHSLREELESIWLQHNLQLPREHA